MLRIMCKHVKLDKDFSEKSLEELNDIINDDDSLDGIPEDYTPEERMDIAGQYLYKIGLFLEGKDATFGDYICQFEELS